MRHTIYFVCLDNLNTRQNCTSSEMLHKLHREMLLSQQMLNELENEVENKAVPELDLQQFLYCIVACKCYTQRNWIMRTEDNNNCISG